MDVKKIRVKMVVVIDFDPEKLNVEAVLEKIGEIGDVELKDISVSKVKE